MPKGSRRRVVAAAAVATIALIAFFATAHVTGGHEDFGGHRTGSLLSSVRTRLDSVSPSVYMEESDGLEAMRAVLKSSGPLLKALMPSLQAAAGGLLCDLLLGLSRRPSQLPSHASEPKPQQNRAAFVAGGAVLAAFVVGLCVSCRCRRRRSAGKLRLRASSRTVEDGMPATPAKCAKVTSQAAGVAPELSCSRKASPSPERTACRTGEESEPDETFTPQMTDSSGSSEEEDSTDVPVHLGRRSEVLTSPQQNKRLSYPLSRGEKQVRLCQLLDQERVAAVQESRHLRRQVKAKLKF
eukprot:gb/GFBE01054912.1/.p1 GENE.gb/GFBE01054912.1/~~gb/GFBE01054912.1/.p1  ORF type:complete len:297 (+),score=38.96 gb/GFBE01054912.1/:1-891(+)